jgi:uncharacterized membrane protein
MDLAKLLAIFLTSLIATFSITFNYRIKVRSDDPAIPEKEKLSRIGKIALLVVVIAGLFSLFSEIQTQRDKLTEKIKAAGQAKQETVEAQKKQEELNRVSQRLLQEMRENLILIQEIQGRSKEQKAMPKISRH